MPLKLLAIDTSLAVGSVAAADDDRTTEILMPTAGEHAARIGTALVEAAERLGWRVGDAEVVAVVRGPGSFTGLRVGIAAAKGVAWATGAALVGVSGFEAIASRTALACGGPRARLHLAYDAGRGELFVTEAEPDGPVPGRFRLAPPRLVAVEAWLAELAAGSIVSGPGLERLNESLRTRGDLVVAPEEAWRPTAADAIRLARARHAAGEHDDPATLVPDYLRPSYADEPAGRPA